MNLLASNSRRTLLRLNKAGIPNRVATNRVIRQSSSRSNEQSEDEIGIVAQKLDAENGGNTSPTAFYKGPFASIALRLKRVSLTTAIVGGVGMPASVIIKHGSEAIPVGGQLAVAGTAAATAVGSTLLLSYCFNPYVHKMEYINPETRETIHLADYTNADDIAHFHIKATTRSLVATEIETIFNPETEIGAAPSSRPFCNFVAAGIPMYAHPELINDPRLLKVLEKSASKSHM
mmetsp:Transcript_15072/g.19692  ORF Transcript_15072/g.19692 Transcript_15072/m.19692 type:complete len:233 (-) Transcript_15072:748-1446(-)|eukprot:CAMPEP_0116064832 /NCGR_PEP_ID=MMETSP0322-20121206/9357_1 /TAXON_ID=163516 /ORGANISM="Leptocylindrus danicus var. apora, Strain B651" /LENGTH=232 /DNA_ID=CAMNT_0003550941 /DNA_START=173 /DNA_END=871 /DNA_ORIENTATION=-